MHLDDTGTGPALVLLHGSPSPVDALAPVAEAYVATRRILTPHLPGYGKSLADPAPVSLATQASRLEEELLARGVRECAVVGHSLGGYRALQLAVSPRIRVTHAVLLAGFARLEPDVREEKRRLAAALRAGEIDLATLLPRAFLPPAHASLAGAVEGWATATTNENLANEQDAVAACEDLTPALPSVGTAIVARVGDLDVAVPPACAEVVFHAARGARLEVVPGCGHLLLLEDREGTLASIRRALG